MKIAIDVSPLEGKRSLSHRVRGIGFYVENLKKFLLRYYPQYDYQFFSKEGELTSPVDVIHYPYFEPFFLTLSKIKKIPTVVTVHDLTPLVFPKKFPPGIRGKIKWLLQKRALSLSDAIIADSESSKKDIMKFTKISEERIHVVYLAQGEEFKHIVLDQRKKESIRKKYQLPDKFALYVGDATWNKNLPRLIKSVQKARVPLVMTGKALVTDVVDKNNPWNQDLLTVQEMAEKSKNINRVGFVPTQDLVCLYNLATVFIMPSVYEGFGLPILEAMACGCPVISSKEGSLNEISGDAAYFIDPSDIKSIEDGILKLFSDEDLRRTLISKGFKQVKNFTWEKTVRETIRVYESVASFTKGYSF